MDSLQLTRRNGLGRLSEYITKGHKNDVYIYIHNNDVFLAPMSTFFGNAAEPFCARVASET